MPTSNPNEVARRSSALAYTLEFHKFGRPAEPSQIVETAAQFDRFLTGPSSNGSLPALEQTVDAQQP